MKPLEMIKKQRELFVLLDQYQESTNTVKKAEALKKANPLMMTITGRSLNKNSDPVTELNALMQLNDSDFNSSAGSSRTGKFYDVLNQQRSIMAELKELDTLKDHAQLFVDVGIHISLLRATLTTIDDDMGVSAKTMNNDEAAFVRQSWMLKSAIKVVEEIGKKKLSANPRRDVALKAATKVLEAEQDIFEKASEFSDAVDELIRLRALRLREKEASKLNPKEEFDRVSKKGTDFLSLCGIDVNVKTPKLDPDESYIERIIRLADTPEFRAEMLNFHEDKEKADRICDFMKGSTMGQIVNSGLINKKLFDMITATKAYSHEQLVAIGQPLIDATNQMIALSTITDKQAEAFIKNIEVDEFAIDDLQAGGYAGDKGLVKFKKDLADCYRLMNGKVDVKKITSSHYEERAHYNHATGEMAISENIEKTTVWHELSHSLEYIEPQVLAAVKAFLADRLSQARANGSGIKRLFEIYPRVPFLEEEIAIEDSAFSHYVTKLYTADEFIPASPYNISASEVISMGIESLTDPFLAGRLINHDPKHAAFVMGILLELRENQ